MDALLPRLLRRIIPTSSGPRPQQVLPAGNYYTVLWRIPETFGGMTSVALERSSAFARQDNRPVEILTFSPNNSGKDREQELKTEGRLDDRVSILNIWEDLSTWSDTALKRMKGTAEPDLGALKDALPHTSGNTREQRTDDAGTVLQTDYYSTQGHLRIIDRPDATNRGTKGGRLLTLLDSRGRIVAQWRSGGAFYKAWLNVVFGNEPSYVIVDSGYASSTFRTYRKKRRLLPRASQQLPQERKRRPARTQPR